MRISRSAAVAAIALAACNHVPGTNEPKPSPPVGSGSGSGGSGSAEPAGSGVGGGPHTPPAVPKPIVKQGDRQRAPVESPHGAPIRALAATADGTAALTADEQDGLRLWPALDGSREPRIVDLPRPKQLALAKDGDGFLAAILDDVGGLTIARLDAGGRTLQRASVEPELAFLGVAMTAKGPLAWRNDQTLVQFDRDGNATAMLAGQAGERLVTIAFAGTRAVAIVETASDQQTHRAARVLDVDALTWGASLESPAELGAIVALSPSGTRLATVVQQEKTGIHLLVVDTAGKRVLLDRPNTAAQGLGFVDDEHLALINQNAFELVEVKGAPAAPKPLDPANGPVVPFVSPQGPADFAIAAGRLIAPRNDELAIATTGGTQFLGYGLESPNVAAVGGDGRLAIGLGDTFALLDRDLAQAATFERALPKGRTVQELHWLGGDTWLVEGSDPDNGKTTIALVDAAKATLTPVFTALPVAPILMFEPSTNILTLSLGDAPQAYRYNAAKQSFDKLLVLPKPNGFEQRELAPVAPALARNVQLISVQMRETTTIRWSTSATADTGPSTTVDGSLAAIDRAGHVYVWRNGADKKLELAVYDGGQLATTLATEGPTTVWPDPSGKRVVAIAGRTISLLGLDGTKAWSIPLAAATEAHWLDDGTIALITASGIARVDAKTGAIGATRCGWRFGLAAQPHPFLAHTDSLCRLP